MTRKLQVQMFAGLCLLVASLVHAHDCSGPDDCSAPPVNINAVTGLIAAAAAIALYTRSRRRNGVAPLLPWDNDPCADLAREVQLGDETIRELERRASQWKAPSGPPEGWSPTTGLGPSLPSLPGSLPSSPDAGIPAATDSTPASGTSAPSAKGRVAAVLGWTPGGKRKVMVCKPIMGRDGQITGYAMTEEEVDDVPGKAPEQPGDPLATGGDNPNTVHLPGGRRLHIDPMEEWLTGKSTAAEALARERADQQRRRAALRACQQAAAPTTTARPAPVAPPVKAPVDIDSLAKALADTKAEFEKLQKELREQVGARLTEIDQLVHDTYDPLWAQAMQALDDYFSAQKKIAGPVRELWNARADMDWALALADAGDEALQILQLVAPELLEMRALSAAQAAKEASLAARLAREEASLASRGLAAEARAAEELAYAKDGLAKGVAGRTVTQEQAKAVVTNEYGRFIHPDNLTNMAFTDMKVLDREAMEALQAARGKTLNPDVSGWFNRNRSEIVLENGKNTLHRTVHETIHSAQNPALGGQFGEALTEHLTTKITKPFGLTSPSGYADYGYVELAQRIENLAGPGAIEKAFFGKDGQAFTELRKLVDANAFGGPGTLKKVVDLSKNAANDPWWAMKAQDLLIPKTPRGAFMGGI